jgi:hypothetical protein
MGRAMLLLLAGVGLLAGCGPEAEVVNPAPPGISYRVDGPDIADVNERAARYCGQYGKRAQLKNIDHSSGAAIAVYDCS